MPSLTSPSRRSSALPNCSRKTQSFTLSIVLCISESCVPTQQWRYINLADAKADSTLRSSLEVPQPSTNRALRWLTSEVGRDPVYSTRYGRQRGTIVSMLQAKKVEFLPLYYLRGIFYLKERISSNKANKNYHTDI